MNKTNFQQSLREVASFRVKNTSNSSVRVCFFPGHYDTLEVVEDEEGKLHVSYADPTALKNAGFDCQQVADDYNSLATVYRTDGRYPVTVTAKDRKTRYRDFLNYIKYSGVSVSKIRITDLLPNSNHEIFGQDIEISRSAVGNKIGTDILNLSSYINPTHFLQNFIDINLEEHQNKLNLDETTLLFMEIPAGADFQIDYTLV